MQINRWNYGVEYEAKKSGDELLAQEKQGKVSPT